VSPSSAKVAVSCVIAASVRGTYASFWWTRPTQASMSLDRMLTQSARCVSWPLCRPWYPYMLAYMPLCINTHIGTSV
jgi:hypothetical protein